MPMKEIMVTMLTVLKNGRSSASDRRAAGLPVIPWSPANAGEGGGEGKGHR